MLEHAQTHARTSVRTHTCAHAWARTHARTDTDGRKHAHTSECGRHRALLQALMRSKSVRLHHDHVRIVMESNTVRRLAYAICTEASASDRAVHFSQCRQRVHNQPKSGTRCSRCNQCLLRCNQCLLRCNQCGALLLAACGDATAPRPAMLQHRGHAERLRVRLRGVAAANSALLPHARISHLSVWLSWQSVRPPPTSKPSCTAVMGRFGSCRGTTRGGWTGGTTRGGWTGGCHWTASRASRACSSLPAYYIMGVRYIAWVCVDRCRAEGTNTVGISCVDGFLVAAVVVQPKGYDLFRRSANLGLGKSQQKATRQVMLRLRSS